MFPPEGHDSLSMFSRDLVVFHHNHDPAGSSVNVLPLQCLYVVISVCQVSFQKANGTLVAQHVDNIIFSIHAVSVFNMLLCK